MTDRILPDPDRCATAAIDALVALRPSAAAHITSGRYGHIIHGYRAQAVLSAQRVADEVAQSSVRSASGQGLVELAASEFDVVIPSTPSAAVGVVRLSRPVLGSAGLIPAGTRFRRVANPDALPIGIAPAAYVSTVPIPVRVTDGAIGAPLSVPVVASSANTAGNVPLAGNGPFAADGVDPASMQVAATLFDPGFYVDSFEAAGGSSGPSDATIKRACFANGTGQYGPVSSANLAAALSVPGASRAVVLDDPLTGASCIYAVDESWGWSQRFADAVAATVTRDALGFGCILESGKVVNQFVEVEAAVVLRTQRDAGNLDAIAENLRAAAVAYFDDRDDWYRWSLSGLRAALSRADRRIRGCSTVVVRDAFTKATVTPGTVTVGPPLTHVYVGRRGVTVTA